MTIELYNQWKVFGLIDFTSYKAIMYSYTKLSRTFEGRNCLLRRERVIIGVKLFENLLDNRHFKD